MTRISGILLVGAFLVAACGGTAATPTPTVAPTASASPTSAPTGTPTTGPTGTPAGSPAASGSPGSTGSPAAGGDTVSVATSLLGEILVGADGLTLYGFTPDEAAGKPTCNGDCAALWPPLTVTGTDFTVGTGLDKSMFTLVARDDGTMQLAVNDHPLYYYTPDDVSGDTKGQDFADKWFVVGTDGELIGAPGT